MTVGELIAQLQTFPAEARVLTVGHEHGYQEPFVWLGHGFRQRKNLVNWAGDFELSDAYGERVGAAFSAVVIGRFDESEDGAG